MLTKDKKRFYFLLELLFVFRQKNFYKSLKHLTKNFTKETTKKKNYFIH